MATVSTGPVSCVLVGDDFAFTQITNAATNQQEAFVLWSNPGDIPIVTRIEQSMWVAMLRDALSNQVNVTIFHPDNSAVVNSLQLGG